MLEHLRQLVRYRELIRNLTLRDLKVRYRNSFLGFFWAWGNPVLMTAVFYFVFTVMQKSSINNFALFILIGWIVWSFTTTSITEGIASVIGGTNLIKKIYFPREALPTSAVLANAVNFLLTLPLVFALIVFYQVNIQLPLLLYFPIIFICQVALVMGITYVLAALNVFYRDTGVITGVLLTAWFFLTPVFYPVDNVSGTWNNLDIPRLWRILNPMASIIEAYRNIFYGAIDGAPPGPPDFDFLLRTFVTCVGVLLVGYVIFTRLSRRFGEEL
jgi:homopolymeric O-antigen transport system permease protein